MSDSLTVPPAVTVAFERYAARVCDLARLDYADVSPRIEIVHHLKERWRNGCENGLSTEAAEERALGMFGSETRVAASLRRPLHHRLRFFTRYRSERFLLFLGAYAFFSWLTVLDVFYRKVYDNQVRDVYELSRMINQIMLPFDRQFFLGGMGTFAWGLLAVAAVILIQWRPACANPVCRWFLQMRTIFGIFPLAAATILATAPTYLTFLAFAKYEKYFLYQGFCAMHLLAVAGGLIGAGCLLVEWVGVPARYAREREKNQPFAVEGVDPG